MRKLNYLTILVVAISFIACNSSEESVNEHFLYEKSKGPIIVIYKASKHDCITANGDCDAKLTINIPDSKAVYDSEMNSSYLTLYFKSENHEGDDLIDFPGVYYDAKMTGIGIGIDIPKQKSRWIEETGQYVLKFQYK